MTDLVVPSVVRLDIPAHPQFVGTVRLVTAAAAADAGMTVDELDDLRLGVNELVSALVDRAAPTARIAVELEVGEGSVVVRGRVEGDEVDAPPGVDDLTERIVAAVADAYELQDRSFRFEKHATQRGR